jgi:hypothetical protein
MTPQTFMANFRDGILERVSQMPPGVLIEIPQGPQGLTPQVFSILFGTTKVVP